MYSYGYKYSNQGKKGTSISSVSVSVDQSWKGNTSAFTFSVSSSTPNTYNTIIRDADATSFIDRMIESNETSPQGIPMVFSGDVLTDANYSCFYGVSRSGLWAGGVSYTALDYCLWGFVSGATIIWRWFELGVQIGGDLKVTTRGDKASWSIQYDGANNMKAWVDGVQVVNRTSTYTNQTMACYLLGRSANSPVSDHISLVTKLKPNKSTIWLGDSITHGRAGTGLVNSNYPSRILNKINNTSFNHVILATSGNTTANLISTQLPQASKYYNSNSAIQNYTTNDASVMIGINDVRADVPAATIKANLATIVSTLQSYSFNVKLYTLLKDFTLTAPQELVRQEINAHIIAGTPGQNQTINTTGTTLETEVALYTDGLHPGPDVYEVLANTVYHYYS